MESSLVSQAIKKLQQSDLASIDIAKIITLLNSAGGEAQEVLARFILSEHPDIVHSLLSRYMEIKQAVQDPTVEAPETIIQSIVEDYQGNISYE